MKGFTLIETLVVLSILTLMTSMLFLYNHAGEKQILLLREKARLIGTIFRAKSFALNMLIEDTPACGYGVHIGRDNYFIYRDKAIFCRTSDHVYGSASDEIMAGSIVALSPGLQWGNHGINDILFIPPNPDIFLNGGKGLLEGDISLLSVDGKSRVSITITNAGQISGE